MSSKPRHRFASLTPQQLREFATLLTSGIPIADALAKSSIMAHAAGPMLHKQLAKGSSLPAALAFFRMVSASEQVYLAALNNAGHLSQALQQLASDYESRDSNRHSMRSKFYVIYLLLFVGWGASLAQVAAAAPQSLFAVLVWNTLACLVSFTIIHAAAGITLKDGWWWLDKAWRFGMRGFKACQWTEVSLWYRLFGQQLAAGVDGASALRLMRGLTGHSSNRSAINAAAKALESGQPLSQALAENNLLPNAEFRAVLVSAEASGRVSESLIHQAKLAAHNLEIFHKKVMFWIPKALYALCGAVALVMVL